MANEYTKETLLAVAINDVDKVWPRDVEYGRSWQKRGGVGAFMMLARKFDRMEERLKVPNRSADGELRAGPYDLFEQVRADPRTEGLLDDVRDLRRYLLLVEAKLIEMGVVKDVKLLGRV